MTHAVDLSLATLDQRRAELRAKVAELHDLRIASADADYIVETLKARLLGTMTDESAAALTANANVRYAEIEVKALAIDLYRLDPSSKQVAPGVSIAVRVGVNIAPAEALRWATSHDMFLLPVTADLKAMEKFCLATTLPLDLAATVVETPTVRLASDLSAALEAAS